VKEAAIADTLEAYLYYESKSDGLGEKFITSLQNAYDQISLNPKQYSFIDKRKKLRDVKLNGFPYVVIYDVDGKKLPFMLLTIHTNISHFINKKTVHNFSFYSFRTFAHHFHKNRHPLSGFYF